MTGDKSCALACVPPAQHCIFCLSAFCCPLTRVSQGTDSGYPQSFSPMRAFRTAPTAESRRLSELFSSRLCTELQNGLEELVICYAAFKMRWRRSCGPLRFRGWAIVSVFPADVHRIAQGSSSVIKPVVEKYWEKGD